MTRSRFAVVLVAPFFFVACGGASSPPPITPPTPTPDTDAGSSAPTSTVSVVRFDDLGLSFAVPSGFRVLGDDDLAARVRASANPRLTAALQGRASQKKALPLLTLSKDTLTITLSVMLVPPDATAAELVAQQRAVMGENLEAFAVADGPKDRTIDGVLGSELGSRYAVRATRDADAGAKRMSASMRVFVRRGLAVLAIAAWPDADSGRDDEARGTLDGLHFYEPPAPR